MLAKRKRWPEKETFKPSIFSEASRKVFSISQSSLEEISIPTPLELEVEL